MGATSLSRFTKGYSEISWQTQLLVKSFLRCALAYMNSCSNPSEYLVILHRPVAPHAASWVWLVERTTIREGGGREKRDERGEMVMIVVL